MEEAACARARRRWAACRPPRADHARGARGCGSWHSLAWVGCGSGDPSASGGGSDGAGGHHLVVCSGRPTHRRCAHLKCVQPRGGRCAARLPLMLPRASCMGLDVNDQACAWRRVLAMQMARRWWRDGVLHSACGGSVLCHGVRHKKLLCWPSCGEVEIAHVHVRTRQTDSS